MTSERMKSLTFQQISKISSVLVLQKLGRGIVVHLARRSSSSVVSSASKIVENPESRNDSFTVQKKPQRKLVAAAFESLKSDTDAVSEGKPLAMSETPINIDDRIVNAKTVNGILSITENSSQVTRKHALKVVSILSQWTSINKVKLSEFENDPRFIKLCRMLGRSAPKNGPTQTNNKSNAHRSTDDLNTVLGIAGDDEAAKLVASIGLPQMVKVMSTLAHKKRRSTPLLRALAFNISSSTEQLDLKQCGDLLYSMASLNFPDAVLIAKVCADMLVGLPKNEDKSAVVGSILTSFGLLKYRDVDVLESLVDWVLKHADKCRPQDISALFLTMATLNFKSQNMEKIKERLVNSLVQGDFPKQNEYLSYIWALTLLGVCNNNHIESVLSNKFLETLTSEHSGLSPTAKMKLLNINAYAKLLATDYKGPFLDEKSPIFTVPITHSKSKQTQLNGMLDALKNLLSNEKYMKTLVDTKMGFLIDTQCTFDHKRNPLPLDKEHPKGIKIAIMIVDFHDMCHGADRSISGIMNLYFDLLQKSGYKVLTIPYNEFSTSDKILKRVQYLEGKLKNIVSGK